MEAACRDKVPWLSISILILGGLSAVSSLAFILVERSWAKEPVFPVHLLVHYDVATSYLSLGMQNALQTSVCSHLGRIS